MTTAATRTTPGDPIRLEGELTIYTAAETLTRLRDALQGRSDCALDLEQVSEIDGAGLQLLLWVERTARARGADLWLTAHSDAVAEVLSLLHLERRFGIEPAEAAEGGSA